MNLTLADLAEEADLTASFLSQVERDITSPSVATLKRIADILGVPVGYFFEDLEEPELEPKQVGRRSPVVKEHERKILSPNRGVTFYLLNPDMSGPIEFIYDVFEPGACTGEDPYTHPGVECGLILEGELEVQVGEEIYILKKGDSITFSSEEPHRKRNPGKEQSISVWANTPPWF
jgi:transcriptional regulator with XRE-family HTH domain